jgi:hypothetical protein
MFKKYLLTFVIATSTVYGGCANEKVPFADSKIELGTMTIALTQAGSQGRTYRVSGMLDAQVHDPNGGRTVVSTFDLGSQSTSYFTASLRPATYDFIITSFQIFVTQSGVETEVTSRATLTSNSATATIVRDQNTNVVFSFRVAGEVVTFDPCTTPSNLACASHDNDGDQLSNGVECPTGASCVDTDNDGQVDAQDTDSDGDGYRDDDLQESNRLNACLPYSYAPNCTAANSGSGSGTINIEIQETCDAGGLDTCGFGGDAGTTATPDAGQPTTTPEERYLTLRAPSGQYEFGAPAFNEYAITVTTPGYPIVEAIESMVGQFDFSASYTGPVFTWYGVMIATFETTAGPVELVGTGIFGMPGMGASEAHAGSPLLPATFTLRTTQPQPFRSYDWMKIEVKDINFDNGTEVLLARKWIAVNTGYF